MGVPPNGWLTMENPIKMDDLGVPPFWEIPIYFEFQKICFQQNSGESTVLRLADRRRGRVAEGRLCRSHATAPGGLEGEWRRWKFVQ